MALKTSVKVISVDSKATKITVKDTTGFYSEANLGGYGDPNPSHVRSIIFTLSRLGCSPQFTLTQELHNENGRLPSIASIMGGEPIVFDSYTIGGSEGNVVLNRFADGVIDIAMHTVLELPVAVSGDECQYTLHGAGLDALTSYEHVLIGTHLYAIDKSKDTVGGTILYLKEPLKGSVSVIYPVESAYTKALVDARTNNLLLNAIAAVANPHKLSECEYGDLTSAMKLFVGKFSAQVSFEKKDYHRAEEILNISKDL